MIANLKNFTDSRESRVVNFFDTKDSRKKTHFFTVVQYCFEAVLLTADCQCLFLAYCDLRIQLAKP